MLSNRRSNRNFALGAVILATSLSAGTPAFSARMNFDGSWSVLVITDSGSCERAYRYGIQISNGQVFSQAQSGADIFGRVTPRGAVNVRVRQGDQEAIGTGRLSQESGGGSWSGSSPYQQCAGHWIAERRG
jgi:hypothetical protein